MEKTLTYKKYGIAIDQDLDPIAPDSMREEVGDDGVILLGFNDRYFWVKCEGFELGVIQAALCGGKYEDGSEHYDAKRIAKEYHIYEADGYVHSGVALRPPKKLARMSIDDAYSFSPFCIVLIKKSETKTPDKLAAAVVKEADDYVQGMVYRYTVTDPDDGMQVAAAGNFFGYPEGVNEAIEYAKEEVNALAKDRLHRRREAYRKIKSHAEFYDSGEGPMDRYTMIYLMGAFAFSTNALSPQGFNQYIGQSCKLDRAKCGKRIAFDRLPRETREAVVRRLMD